MTGTKRCRAKTKKRRDRRELPDGHVSWHYVYHFWWPKTKAQ
jgi:hypothetical protein